MRRVLLAGLVLGLGVTAAWGAGPGMVGDWATSSGSVVRVAGCGDALCMTVVKVSPEAKETTDTMNPDAGMRGRRLCGLPIGDGFKADGDGTASGGRIYDPESGKTYSAKMERKGDTLRLRGFVGVSLFGRTEVWKHIGTVEACR